LLDSRVPPSNIKLLKAIAEMSSIVAKHSQFNKMTAQNLGVVLEPNVLRKKVYEITDISKISELQPAGFMEDCIEHYDEIFKK
jgi:hypothetical protein